MATRSRIHRTTSLTLLLTFGTWIPATAQDLDDALGCGLSDPPPGEIGCGANIQPLEELTDEFPEIAEPEVPPLPDDAVDWAPAAFDLDTMSEIPQPLECIGGAFDGASCEDSAGCPGGECGIRVCVGGPSDGLLCAESGGCPLGDCVVWDFDYETDEEVELTSPDFPGCAPNFCAADDVWGTDDRERIRGTTGFPWRTIGKIQITFPDGSRGGATGVLVGPRHVLTSGHAVHQRGKGGWVTSLTFAPGQNGTVRPYGTANARRIFSWRGWTDRSAKGWDLALVVLDRQIGNRTGWMGYSTGGPTDVGEVRNLSGYPGDKPAGTQWFASGTIASRTALNLNYTIDTEDGQSGSPVWAFTPSNGQRIIRGIHRGAKPTQNINNAVRITSGKFRAIQKWIADNPFGGGGCADCSFDCNNNGVGDDTDILLGEPDVNENGILDICEGACCLPDATCDDTLSDIVCAASGGVYVGASCLGDGDGNGVDDACDGLTPCLADLSDNGSVDFADILVIISVWGPCGPKCPEDLSGNGSVDFADILLVIAGWGPC